MTLHVPCLEGLESALIENAILHDAVGNIGAVSIILPFCFARLLVEPNEALVAGGQDNVLVAHGRAREEHGVGLILPAQRSRLLVHGLAITQRVAEVEVFLIHTHTREDGGVIGHHALDGIA